jgi:methylmalonyl-CoA/ethylmalonyl-CoA epimerase
MDRAIPVLPTDDIAAAKTFYVDGLGFRVTWEASDDGHTGLLGLARGEMHLTLDCPMDGHGRHACVSLHVDDVDAYFAEWSARVAVPAAPANQDWGARTFSVHDPSGNTLFVLGPRRDAAAATAD